MGGLTQAFLERAARAFRLGRDALGYEYWSAARGRMAAREVAIEQMIAVEQAVSLADYLRAADLIIDLVPFARMVDLTDR